MKLLVCNAGSSSLKFSLVNAESEQLLATGAIDWVREPAQFAFKRMGGSAIHKQLALRGHRDAIRRIVDQLQAEPDAPLHELSDLCGIGHRVVHGGPDHTSAVMITPEVLRTISDCSGLAPLHNTPSLEVIETVRHLAKAIPQVAAFDTAFHASLTEDARTYPLPRAWTRDWGLRRYGFHGLNHSYCAARAAQMLGLPRMRLIIAHLGHGASLAAVLDGVCVDTTMGFTPLEGLMMGTRSGSVDPGLLIYLLRQKGITVDQLDRALNHESGLLGVSGISSDMRQVLDAQLTQPDARLAVEIYIHRLRQTIGAMAATLGGVDCLVFTAGVGENSAEIRARVCEHLEFLGIQLDSDANRACMPDADIASSNAAVRVLVIAAREDLTIVREMRRLLDRPATSAHPGSLEH